MSRQQTVTAPEYKLHEEGVFYEGVIDRIEDDDEGLYGPQYKIVIHLDDDQKPGEPVKETWHFVTQNYTTHEKNKLRIFYDGVLGRSEPVEIDGVVDVDDLVNKRLKVIFQHGKKQDGSPKDSIIIVKPAPDAQKNPF